LRDVPFLRFLALLMLALWIGGLAVLGAIAAPTVFSVLQSNDPVGGRTLAGTLFGEILGRFQAISWALGGLLLATLAARAALGPRPRWLKRRIWTLVAMLTFSLVSGLVLAPRIDAIRRDTPGAIAALPATDVRRVEFGRLHGASDVLLILTLVAGLGLLWYEARDTGIP
jgi:hypothetical protein